MASEESFGRKGHRAESQVRYPGYINYEREDGSEEIGVRALAAVAFTLITGFETKPTNPRTRTGITFHHDDGSYDTGTRAVANVARVVKGQPPKIYSRTMRPL